MAAGGGAGKTVGIVQPEGIAMRAAPALFVLLAGLSAACFAADTPTQPRSRGEAKEMFSADGLAKVEVKGIEVAYKRPEARLSEYKRVLVRPVGVSIRKDWVRSAGLHGVRPTAAEVENVRTRVGTFVREEFEKELTAAGVSMAQEPADDVLEIDLAITDLYAAAPDIQVPARKDVWALSAGEMTLVGELRDSVTGETQFRFYDHGKAREWSRPRRILFNENEIEARKLARSWAKALLAGFQAARK